MSEKLELIPGHWYWTTSGYRAIVLFGSGGSWHGVVLRDCAWVEMWSTHGDAISGLKSHTLVAHHGPTMPEPEDRRKVIEWYETSDGRHVGKIGSKYVADVRMLGDGSCISLVLVGGGWLMRHDPPFSISTAFCKQWCEDRLNNATRDCARAQ